MAYYARSEGVLGEKQLLHDHLQKVLSELRARAG